MILCCGEALIDMIPQTLTEGQTGFVPCSGGAVFNTAIALGRLGTPVSLLSGLSTDMFGAHLQRDLAASKVGRAHLVLSNRPTTLAFVQLTDGHAQYAFFDENSAGRLMALADMPTPAAETSALFFGGISLVSEPAADAYLSYAQREGQTRVVMLDPNIRPAFIQNESAYRARLHAMLAVADIVKVSDEDIDWLCPGASTLDEKVAQLKARGPSCVIVTKGSKGAEAYLPDGGHIAVEAPKAKVADTVGAGDTFNAGVLAYLQSSGGLVKEKLTTLPAETWEKALQHAARAAAITVARAGANPPWAREL